jgi:diguanylate cyclase (GGDEF)-like protein
LGDWNDDRYGDPNSGEATMVRRSEPTRVGNAPGRYEPGDRAPTFSILEGPRSGEVIYPISVGQRATFIGRDKEVVDWWIDDPSISRRHCRVFVYNGPDGPVLRIQDLGSTNGTFVNGQQIREADLQSGDKIHFADVLVRYDLMDQADLQFQQSLVDRAQRGEKDPLTGLLTRTFLADRLGKMLDEAHRLDLALSLIMIDLDHFKQVNDNFGHAAGDVALRRTARVIHETIRDRDPAVRMGGEELAAFLPGVPLIEGYHIAERIRISISTIDFDDCFPGLGLTASVGVAQWRRGETAAVWLNRADEALYAAKGAGRNRTIVDDRRAP